MDGSYWAWKSLNVCRKMQELPIILNHVRWFQRDYHGADISKPVCFCMSCTSSPNSDRLCRLSGNLVIWPCLFLCVIAVRLTDSVFRFRDCPREALWPPIPPTPTQCLAVARVNARLNCVVARRRDGAVAWHAVAPIRTASTGQWRSLCRPPATTLSCYRYVVMYY